jgi:hypothetical protein
VFAICVAVSSIVSRPVPKVSPLTVPLTSVATSKILSDPSRRASPAPTSRPSRQYYRRECLATAHRAAHMVRGAHAGCDSRRKSCAAGRARKGLQIARRTSRRTTTATSVRGHRAVVVFSVRTPTVRASARFGRAAEPDLSARVAAGVTRTAKVSSRRDSRTRRFAHRAQRGRLLCELGPDPVTNVVAR